MAITKVINVDVNTGDANTELQKLEGSFKDVDQAAEQTNKSVDDVAGNGGAIAILDQLTGGLATRFRDAFEASKLFNLSLKGMRTALIATGIGALVVALGLVVVYWDDIKKAVNGVDDSVEELNTTLSETLGLFDLLTDNLDSLFLFNDLLIDPAASLKVLRNEFNELDRAIKNLEKTGTDSDENVKSLVGSFRELLVAKRKIKEVTEEITKLEEDGIEQGQIETLKARLIDLFQTKAELEDLFKVPDKEKEEKEDKDPKNKTKDEKIGFDDTAQKKIEEEIKALEEINRIRKEFAEKNREDDLGQNKLDREAKLLEIEENVTDEVFKRQALFEVNKFFDDEDLRIKQEKADAEQKIAEENADALQKIEDLKDQARKAQLAGVGKSLDEAAKLAGESTATGKALAIAGTTISTFQTAQSAYQSAFLPVPTVASPALGALFAGVAVAGGLANIAKISKIKVPSGGRGSSSSPSAGSTPPPAPSFNLVEGTADSQLSNDITSANNDPVRAVVVSGDVTTAQSVDRNIINESGI